MREHNDIVDRLIGMLDAKYNTRHRTISAEILENLCTHCKEHVDQTFLQKVRQSLTLFIDFSQFKKLSCQKVSSGFT